MEYKNSGSYDDPDGEYDHEGDYHGDEDDEDHEQPEQEILDEEQSEFNSLVAQMAEDEVKEADLLASDPKNTSTLPPLSRPMIRQGLSEIERTADGSGFAYSRLSLPACKIRTLNGELSTYVELKHIDFSENALTEVEPLGALPNLLTINLQHNSVTTLPDLTKVKNLQLLRADDNLITSLLSFRAPSLVYLTLSRNRLSSLKELRDARITFPSVETLDLSYNQLTSLVGIDVFPNLKHLNVAGNRLTSLAGLHKLTKLQTVDLADNKLSKLVEFRALSVLKDLDTIIIARNRELFVGLQAYLAAIGCDGESVEGEYEDSEQVLLELVLMAPQLRRIDTRVITHIERGAANKLEATRRLERAARLAIVEHARAEEEAAAKAEEEQRAREEEEARRLAEEMAAGAEGAEGDELSHALENELLGGEDDGEDVEVAGADGEDGDALEEEEAGYVGDDGEEGYYEE